MKMYNLPFFLFFLIVFVFPLHAQDSIRFDESGLEVVMQRAKTEKKPIFYMAYADW